MSIDSILAAAAETGKKIERNRRHIGAAAYERSNTSLIWDFLPPALANEARLDRHSPAVTWKVLRHICYSLRQGNSAKSIEGNILRGLATHEINLLARPARRIGRAEDRRIRENNHESNHG